MQEKQNKLSLAIVGIGRVARKHTQAVKDLKELYEIKALIDNNQSRQVELNEEFSLGLDESKFYKSLDEFYAQGQSVDVVAIATPSGTHYNLAKLALSHDSNVLVEKPLTLNLKEAQELVDYADSKGLKIAVGHIYRFFPLVDRIQAEIASGKWGKILAADVVVHWGHDQAYYDQAAWRGSWAQDGGALMNQTVHAVDLMTWLLDSKIVTAQGQIRQLCHNIEAEDYGAALFTMDKGFTLRLEGTTNTPPEQHAAKFYISTEKAEFQAGLKNGKLVFSIKTRDNKELSHKYIRDFIKSLFKDGFFRSIKAYKNPHTGIYLDLYKAIKEDRAPRASGLDGLLAVESILAIYKSSLENGDKVKLPLDRDFSLDAMRGFFD